MNRQQTVAFETTIEQAVNAEGIGLHHGVPVKVRILPAAAGTGIVFRRTDLNGFEIPASFRYVARVSYATSLMKQGVLISTTEHLLSALYSLGIANAIVEIDNLEVPILDGSSLPWVELLHTAGRKVQRRQKRFLRIKREVCVEGNGKRIRILPSDEFKFDCDVYFDHPLVGRQKFRFQLTPERYTTDIAPARTFGFEQELDAMRNMGLIRGASLENAVCFTPTGVLNPEGLRFADEPVRHKVLDLIGDLALIGRPMLGHVIAERAGHAMHVALVSKIVSDESLYEVMTLEDSLALSRSQAVPA
ncbi:MAG: UDP-3-O-acyl-N-acetylglucosamine deacetylase [Bryobacter sp.]|nr:UDP-3-O-acyl-N-acetylglucosamine deacetylase [Bryobacter sp.]